MCFLITLAVPTSSLDDLKAVVPRGFRLDERSGSAELEPPCSLDVCALISFSHGGCACGMFVPDRDAHQDRNELEKRVRKYTAKGWSKAKIERALSQAKDAIENNIRSCDPPGYVPQVVEIFQEFSKRCDGFGALVRWEGGPDDQWISDRSPIAIRASELKNFVPEENRWAWVVPH